MNKRLLRYMTVLSFGLILLGQVLQPTKALAGETDQSVDINRMGSIQIQEKYGEGISYSIYQLGIYEEDGNLTYTEDFDQHLEELTILPEEADQAAEVGELAQSFVDMIEKYEIDTLTEDAKTDAEGIVTFEDLQPGYYLVLAESFKAEDGKVYSAAPILTTLPGTGQDYDMEITAKSEMTTEDDTPKTPNNTKKPTGKLPKTGVLWWPVPLLAAVGIFLYIIGYLLELRRRKMEEN